MQATQEVEEATPVTELEKLLRDTELRVLTGYTLADAIREGGKVTNQIVGAWVTDEGSCALGAAYISAAARGYVAH